MSLHPAVEERLARLAPDQRAAATAPPGPVLCVAPAGSGKTTTLVARVCWLVATGTEPRRITAVTFNKRAADELGERLTAALLPLGVAGDRSPASAHLSRAGSRDPDRRRHQRRQSRRSGGGTDDHCRQAPVSRAAQAAGRRLFAAEARSAPGRGVGRAFNRRAAKPGELGEIDDDVLRGIRRLRALADRQRRPRLRRPGRPSAGPVARQR